MHLGVFLAWQEGVEQEKTEQPAPTKPPSVGDMESAPVRRASVRLNTFQTRLDKTEIVPKLTQVSWRSHIVSCLGYIVGMLPETFTPFPPVSRCVH